MNSMRPDDLPESDLKRPTTSYADVIAKKYHKKYDDSL